MVIYGGHDVYGSGGHIPFGDGATYDPGTRTWTRLNPAGDSKASYIAPVERTGHLGTFSL